MFTTVKQNLQFAECYIAKAKDAANRKMEFNLSLDAFINMKLQTHCAYSGEAFKHNPKDGMSFERIDNSKGYINGNVIPVKIKYNAVRNDLTADTIDEAIQTRKTNVDAFKIAIKNAEDDMLRAESLLMQELASPKFKYVIVAKPVITAHKRGKYIQIANALKDAQGLYSRRQGVVARTVNSIDSPKTGKSAKEHLKSHLPAQRQKVEESKAMVDKQRLRMRQFLTNFKTVKRELKVDVANKVTEYREQIAHHEKRVAYFKDMAKRNEVLLKELETIKPALIRFEKLSDLDRQKIELGLPLTTSTYKLLKHKMGYNLIMNHA